MRQSFAQKLRVPSEAVGLISTDPPLTVVTMPPLVTVATDAFDEHRLR